MLKIVVDADQAQKQNQDARKVLRAAEKRRVSAGDPLIGALHRAHEPGTCDECHSDMWVAKGSYNYICEVCAPKKGTRTVGFMRAAERRHIEEVEEAIRLNS